MKRHFNFLVLAIVSTATLLVSCTSIAPSSKSGITGGELASLQCAALAGTSIAADQIGASAGLKSGIALVDSATWTAATPLALSAGPMPEAMVLPATPEFCKVLGHIKPVDPAAPSINFQVNLPKVWNGRSFQHGGGGFNGVLVNGLAQVRGAPFDKPAPLALGFATVGTDSGHQNKPGVPIQEFATNEESFINFAHASYKKVRDVSAALMKAAYGKSPEKMYFGGSSEGGREAITMAQRYPTDFNGVIARVPVINWTGLMHIGITNGLPIMHNDATGGWINAAQTKQVHDAVLIACDALDGLKDGIVGDPVACRAKLDINTLPLSAAKIAAIKTLHSPLTYPFPLANGVMHYPARGPSAEALPTLGVNGPMGGWGSWWTGAAPTSFPTRPDNRSWDYSVGAIQHIYMQKPKATWEDIQNYKMQDYRARVEYVSNLMDATNPDLSAFNAAGGKLILMEYMGDYAQSPYAGIEYFESVQRKMGADKVAGFAKLYAVPGVDHVGSGAPSTADIFTALTAWAERGIAPSGLVLYEHERALPLTAFRSRPMCEWPAVARYKGGNENNASNFVCEK